MHRNVIVLPETCQLQVDVASMTPTPLFELNLLFPTLFSVILSFLGYYRVNYDDKLWQRIISALKSNEMQKIHVSNRAQLIDDAFSLAKVGELNYNTVFELASYLVHESEYEPWYAAAKSLKFIKRILDTHGDKEALENLKVNSLF